jgi:uncharacterized membrane protein
MNEYLKHKFIQQLFVSVISKFLSYKRIIIKVPLFTFNINFTSWLIKNILISIVISLFLDLHLTNVF